MLNYCKIISPRICLTFIFLLSFGSQFFCLENLQGTWKTIVYWSGEQPTCNCTTETNVDTYACSNGDNWNNGNQSFQDETPSGYVVVRVSLNIVASNCPTKDSAELHIKLQDQEVGSVTWTFSDNCFCLNCMDEFIIQSQRTSEGWPGYSYGKLNYIFVNVTKNMICISRIDLMIDYAWINPTPIISSILPGGGPIEGRTSVAVSGFNFYEGLSCKFGNQLAIAAQYLDDVTIICVSPSRTNATEVPITLVNLPNSNNRDHFDSFVSDSNIYFYYYKYPNFSDINPKQGDIIGGTAVTILGRNFWNSSELYCKFGDQEVEGVFLTSNAISCQTPPVSRPGTVNIQISENHQQWSDCPFTFEYKVTFISPLPSFVSFLKSYQFWIILIGGIFLLCTTLVIIFFVWRHKRALRRRGYEALPTEQHQSVIENTVNFGEIKLLEKVGQGSAGEVYRASWLGTEIAVKFLPRHLLSDPVERKKFLHEAQLMQQVRHPNVIQYMGLSSSSTYNICILMEYMVNGSLYEQIHDSSVELSESLLHKIFVDCVKGLGYLHSCKPIIIHRDLKSHNFLVDLSWKIKIADFGLSRMIDAKKTMTACGTPSWTAPEILRREKYCEKVDIYSLGIVFWECLIRENPYKGLDAYQVVFAVATQGLRPVIPDSVSPALSLLIQKCWSEDPSKRPSASNLLEQLHRIQ